MSHERCPACRGRLSEAPTCPRCGCDLSLVRRAEAQARQLLARSVQAWARGLRVEAAGLARAAQALDNSPLAAAVLRGLERSQQAWGRRAGCASQPATTISTELDEHVGIRRTHSPPAATEVRS